MSSMEINDDNYLFIYRMIKRSKRECFIKQLYILRWNSGWFMIPCSRWWRRKQGSLTLSPFASDVEHVISLNIAASFLLGEDSKTGDVTREHGVCFHPSTTPPPAPETVHCTIDNKMFAEHIFKSKWNVFYFWTVLLWSTGCCHKSAKFIYI